MRPQPEFIKDEFIFATYLGEYANLWDDMPCFEKRMAGRAVDDLSYNLFTACFSCLSFLFDDERIFGGSPPGLVGKIAAQDKFYKSISLS